MFYTYIDKKQWKPRLTMFDVLQNKAPEEFTEPQFSNNYFVTTTIRTHNELLQNTIDTIFKPAFQISHKLAEDLKDKTPNYNVFNIPKKTGSFRTIAAPDPTTANYLTRVRFLLEMDLHLLPHNAAYAYVKGRCTKDALIKHTQNKSNYYLKIDLKDFFTSCNYDFIMTQFKELQIINSLIEYDAIFRTDFETIIKYCLLNDGLPQGSPVSPHITNLIMIPLDYYITEHCNKNGYCYTRYADDILISHPETFNYNDMIKYLRGLLENNSPLTIKTEKTRYGSNKGRNWNLGLMVNQNNEITLGYRKKERLRATIFNFFTDLTNGNSWDTVDVQAFQGTLSYYNKICPKMTEDTIQKYEQKFNKILTVEIQKILNPM